jgi:hypothetical protein
MISMLIKFIGEILGLIKKGELKKASEQLEGGYHIFFREDAAFFRNIPEANLIQKLLQEHNYTNGHLEILAELFNAEAELGLAQENRQDSLEFSRKSLILFEFIDKEQKIYSQERSDKMDAIKKRIGLLKA